MYRLSQLFVTLFAVALSTGLQGQQVTARVAGLESNAKYMSLLEQEQRLHRTEDSVVAKPVVEATDIIWNRLYLSEIHIFG